MTGAQRWRTRVPWAAGLCALVLGGLVLPGGASAGGRATTARGRALFAGKEPLKGRVRDHQSDLPASVVVCHNCHVTAATPPGSLSRPAPRIDRTLLLEARARRGGPPSAYDRAAFCKLLRTGVDPAYVLVKREMPVFDVDDTQCESLWRFLTDQDAGR